MSDTKKGQFSQASEFGKSTPAPRNLPAELDPWRVRVYGDDRDDLRAALSAGSDATDDLIALRCALVAVAEEEPAAPAAAPATPGDAAGTAPDAARGPAPDSTLDPEDRQRALLAVIRLLSERTALLQQVFEYLWSRA